jgi:hypothetical protein
MLEVRKISSNDAYMEGWRKERLGRFTASLIGKLIGEKSDKGIFTTTAMTYIECVAWERHTGKPAKAEFFTDATNHGNSTEPEAIMWYCQQTGKQVLRTEGRNDTHRLILNDDYTACTPDALVCQAPLEKIFDENDRLKVSPLETKCPLEGHRFIKLLKCETPKQLLETEKLYFWQCLHQLMSVAYPKGDFCAYHPEASGRKGRIIEFKKVDLVPEMKFLNATIAHANKEVEKILNLFK